MIETETDNEKQAVKPQAKKRSISPMEKSADSNNLVLNMTFEIENDYNYVYTSFTINAYSRTSEHGWMPN